MANLIRFEPFRELARFEPFGDMDDWLNRMSLRPILREGMKIEPQIKMDVKEVEGKYVVNAEIPGVSKNDIHVTIDGKKVSISAELKQEKETKEGEQMICCERSYGMASRSFTLADEVDQSQVQAKYNDGVLELTLPKKAGTSSQKEIPIS